MTVLAGGWLIVNRLKTAPDLMPTRAQNTAIVATPTSTPFPSSSPAATAPVVKKDKAEPLPAQAKKNAEPAAKQSAKPQATPPVAPIISAQVAEKLNEELREKPAYDQPREAMEYYRLKRVPQGETAIPVEKYLEAKKQTDVWLWSFARMNPEYLQ